MLQSSTSPNIINMTSMQFDNGSHYLVQPTLCFPKGPKQWISGAVN